MVIVDRSGERPMTPRAQKKDLYRHNIHCAV